METQVRPTKKPILFSAPMVRAILEGRKTQTRRIVKRNPPFDRDGLFEWYPAGEKAGFHALSDVAAFTVPSGWAADWCPYGKPGDRLWVRETWFDAMCPRNPEDHSRFFTDETDPAIFYRADGTPDFEGEESEIRWRPSIFMPRWASRITLEITEVRVQRLQDISEEDAEAEGADPIAEEVSGNPAIRYRAAFHSVWTAINGLKSWDANPWVWAITFKPFPTAPSEVQA